MIKHSTFRAFAADIPYGLHIGLCLFEYSSVFLQAS